MDDDVYDIPPTRSSAETPPAETPPFLPPKSTNRLSIRDREGLSRTPADREDLSKASPDSRPKPMPRKTVCYKSSSPHETTVSSTSSVEESPKSAPRPAPRPRPRQSSLRSPAGQQVKVNVNKSQVEESLPPSADEVEEMVNEMVWRELAKEEEEEKWKQQQQDTSPSGQLSSGGTVSNGNWTAQQFPDSLGQDTGKGDKLPEGVLSTDIDEIMRAEEESYYENSDVIKRAFASNRPDTQSGTLSRGGQGYDDGFDSAFGGSDTYEDTGKAQKQTEQPSASSDFEASFDPFVTSHANKSGLPSLPHPGILQPTKVWDRSSDLNPGQNASGAENEGDTMSTAPEDPGSEEASGQRDSDTYEAVWFTQRLKQDKPGMVRPQSDLMAFTPKPQADGGAPPPCVPVYGEPSGEYIGLDPTYNIPPPSLPPPPLPAQAVVRTGPPAVPPRPQHKTPPNLPDTSTFHASSHLTESSTDERFAAESPSSVFEDLPTPGFSAPVHDDDPFKYSGFDTECQMFNQPHSTDAATNIAKEESSIYEVEDFVPKWPQNMGSKAENDDLYSEAVGGAPVAQGSSIRLSQVPPPPPRSRTNTRAGTLDARQGAPSLQPNPYSFAPNDDSELSRSNDSSDSSENLFGDGEFHLPEIKRTSQGSRGAVIIPPVSPRKNERYGYLYKQGGVKANRGWRQRWVVFNGVDLRYYDNNRSQISKKIIPLSSMKKVISDIKESDTNRFKFRLETTLQDRIFLFAADTSDDCCTWTSTLMAAILKNRDGQPGDVVDQRAPDKEGFIRFENYRKFYVAIWGKTLRYYNTFEDFQMHCPVHEIDMRLSSVKDKKKNRLQLSTHYTHFLLVFDSPQEAQSWRMAIEDAIAEGLADDSVLEKVYENDSNRICADCEDENPHWASINLGIVLCKKCAGIHRMFETSVSKIRSLRMDTRVWTPSLIELMKAIGNGNANQFWEHDLLPIQKPTKDSLPEDRKKFTQLKYQQRHYSNQHEKAHNKKMLNEALLQVSAAGDLLTAMQIIFSGADLSYVGGPECENAYDTAKRHGQRLLMELLYQNGGDCSTQDGDSTEFERHAREDVRLQGYLMKTGPAGKTFDQRWCVLEHGALTYYLNDKSTTAKDSIDRKSILCLQEIPSERAENIFELSTCKGNHRVYTFAAESPGERSIWMRTLGKLISPVAVMEHVGMMDFKLAALVFMRDSISEDWRSSWIMISWRLFYFMNKDLQLDHIDLRKATQIRMMDTHGASCPQCMEKGDCFVLSSPGQTFYIQASLLRDTRRIFENVSVAMKKSGQSLLDQQLCPDNVPMIVDRCLAEVYRRGYEEEGIYRKAAIKSQVVSLIQELKADAHAVRLDNYDVHEVANALKRFLRGLDDSLFMCERYSEWVRTSAIEDHNNKFQWYRYLLEKLPLVNYSTLRRIVRHIWKMAENEAHNKMSVEAMCTCFAPTLMHTDTDTVHGNHPGNEIKVLLDLMSQRDYLFQIEQQELDKDDKIQDATRKIQEAHENARKSQPANTFLMPVSMYNHTGQSEMVQTTPATTAQDVVDHLICKHSLSGHNFALTEMLFNGAIMRPLFPSDNILMTTGIWGDWDEAVRKETCLCLTDTETLEKLERYHDTRALFGEVKFADSKSKTKFKKINVGFKQCVLTFYKDSKAKSQLCSWKVEELTIYLGIDSKRSPPTSFGFTFLVNNREEKSKSSSFGHCVALPSEEEMYRWVSALLVAQKPEGLMVWNR